MEQDFHRPVSLPNSVYKTLLKNKDINKTIKEEVANGKSIKSIKSRFFDVTNININDDKYPDLLVKAKSLLSGMSVTRYWIFKGTSKGHVQIGEIGTFSLSILKHKHNRYRIIEGAYPKGDKAYINYFRFNGKKYFLSWSKTEDIK